MANPSLQELVRSAFAADGPLEAALRARGRTYRPSQPQIDYALAAAATFTLQPDERGAPVTLLEAETGTGKSFGYLIPLALHVARSGSRGLVSTFTHVLLDQLIRREAPIVQEVVGALTGKSLSFERRIGFGNYLSPDKILAMADELDLHEKELRDYLLDLHAFATGGEGSLFEWMDINGAIPERISVADLTLTTPLGEEGAKYREHVERSHKADIVITPHALLARHIAFKNQSLVSGDNRPFAAAVIDEGDALPEVLRDVFHAHVSTLQLDQIAKLVRTPASRDKIRTYIEAFKDLVASLAHQPRGDRAKEWLSLADGRYYKAKLSARAIASGLHKEIGRYVKMAHDSEFAVAAEAVQQDLQRFVKTTEGMGDYEVPGISWSPVWSIPAFEVVPFESSRVASRLFRLDRKTTETMVEALIITSATLDAPSKDSGVTFSHYRQQIGLSDKFHNYRSEISGRFSPENFGELKFHLTRPDGPTPSIANTTAEQPYERNPAWIDHCVATLKLIGDTNERTLVLTTSYADVEALSERLRPHLGDRIVEHERGSKLRDGIEKFRAAKNAIWITPSAWEGIDLPGLIKHLVITKLPLATLDSSLANVQFDVFLSWGLTPDAARSRVLGRIMSDAKRKMKQGIGRAIRAPYDSADIWILDPRFPVPSILAEDPRNQLATAHSGFRSFSSCIPIRFRSGFFSAYDAAELIGGKTSEEIRETAMNCVV